MASDLARWLLSLPLMFALAVAPREASAQQTAPTAAQKETARTLMQQGDKQFAAGDYRGAASSYRAADNIVAVSTTGLALAKALAQLGQLVEAVDVLQRVINAPKPDREAPLLAQARKDAVALDVDLAARIPTLQITVIGPPADVPVKLQIDGVAIDDAARTLPQRLNPGEHTVTASAMGFHDNSAKATLAEREQKQIEIKLEAKPPEPKPPEAPPVALPPPVAKPVRPDVPRVAPDRSSSTRTVSWIGFGVGAAGLVMGSVTGGLSLSKQSKLESECPENTCTEDKRADHDSIIALANASNAGFIIGGVGVAVGTVALVVDLTRKPKPSETSAWLRPVVGIGLVGIEGTF
jgi:tetratricopeptide (TPR) repeat protein